MTRRTYTPEYKARLVIEVLQGEKELNTIAAENSISPNMLRNWKGRSFWRTPAAPLTAVGRQRKLAERRPT